MMLKTYEAVYDQGRLVWDGEKPAELRARVLVTVISALSTEDDERDTWLRLSEASLEAAYGPDEPEYFLDDIKRS